MPTNLIVGLIPLCKWMIRSLKRPVHVLNKFIFFLYPTSHLFYFDKALPLNPYILFTVLSSDFLRYVRSIVMVSCMIDMKVEC